MNPWMQWTQRLWRWIAALIGLCALLFALGVGAFRLAIDLLPGYQKLVVERVREATGLTLEFDSVYARIGRYGPEVVFRGARILSESGDLALLTAESGRVSLSIPRTIWFRRIEVGRVAFVRPHLNFVITSAGRIELVGQSALRQPDAGRPRLTLDRLPRGHFAVTDAVLDVLDLRSRQGRFQLTGASVDVVRSGDEIELNGRVELPEHLGAFIDFDGEASGKLTDTASVAWRLRVDARNLDLEQWAAMLPDSFIVPAAGRGSHPGIRTWHRRRIHELAARTEDVGPALRGFGRRIFAGCGRHPYPARRRRDFIAGDRLRAVARGRRLAADESRGAPREEGRTHRDRIGACRLPANREPGRICRAAAAGRDAGTHADARAARRTFRARRHRRRRGRKEAA